MASKNKNTHICAILSYFLVGIIWYFVEKDMQKDDFVKFHVKQNLVLIIASIIWGVGLSILSAVLFFVPFLWTILWILYYVPMVIWIIGLINVIGSKKKELPIIGKYADKLHI